MQNLRQLVALALILFAAPIARADDQEKVPSPFDPIFEKLAAKKVNTLGLTQVPKGSIPGLWLGTGLNGGETDNANDETLGLVAQLPDVEALTIYKGKISREGFAKLADLPKLRNLDIYGSRIDPKAFAVLSKLKALEYLRIQEYPTSDEILSYLGDGRKLKTLHLNKTDGITPATFAKFLSTAESLENLMLFGNFVDDDCLKIIGQRKGMKVLSLDSKKITSKAWVNLAGLTQLQRLTVPGTSLDDEGMKALEGMTDLQDLMVNNTPITDQGMASLAGVTKLQSLCMEGTKITNKGMVHLAAMTELTNLAVGNTDVTAQGLAIVPRKDRMVMLRTGRGALSAPQIFELLSIYPTTQIFDPSGYWTDARIEAAMKELGRELPK